MNEEEFEIEFTDVTLAETEGDYKQVAAIMKQEVSYSEKWVLRSDATISGNMGIGIMEIQCHSNKDVYILDYKASIGDLFYNPDIQVFSMWAQDNGWNVPQPHPDLVRSSKPFWKHFWETLVIDSEYLDKLYGVRPELEIQDNKKGRK